MHSLCRPKYATTTPWRELKRIVKKKKMWNSAVLTDLTGVWPLSHSPKIRKTNLLSPGDTAWSLHSASSQVLWFVWCWWWYCGEKLLQVGSTCWQLDPLNLECVKREEREREGNRWKEVVCVDKCVFFIWRVSAFVFVCKCRATHFTSRQMEAR